MGSDYEAGSGRGRTQPVWTGPTGVSLDLSRGLGDGFMAACGMAICCEIHRRIFGRTFDPWNDEDRAAFDEMGAHTEKCTAVVGTAARWIAEIILREEGHEGDR